MPAGSSATIARFASLLSGRLNDLREALYAPETQKSLRSFSTQEVASLLGVAESTVRQLSLDGEGPEPERFSNGRRAYRLGQINELRRLLAARRPAEALDFLPHRRPGDKLQVLAVANFKGGSGKSTTTVHLCHYLALKGYRVLAIDLDPQASLSSMFGCQPEFDVGPNETLYAAIRYDDERRPLRDVVRETYFPGLDLVPGNLELAEFEHDTPHALARDDRGGDIFFRRLSSAIADIDADYDVVVIDCPPQLGFLTLGALFAATGLLITVHPAMLDVASMGQFLLMTSDLMSVVEEAGGVLSHDFIRFVLTRHNPHDVPQVHVATLLRSLFGDHVLTSPVLETTAIANAGLEKKSLYELERAAIGRETLNRALESVDAVNAEIVGLIEAAWGRRT
ncbi:plasmid partitioning protein RepA [Methylobrevis pamukkalensis]|nr:plasmid partitioning protein RepA [Methylobrevis pamukkalensis]